jgi:hypothetical protein
MKKMLLLGLLLSLFLTACSAIGPRAEDDLGEDGVILIYAEEG